MKLKSLNGLIRKHEGPAKLKLATPDGKITVSLVKSDLIAGLAAAWPDNKTETGLNLVDGFLTHEDHGDVFAVLPAVATIPHDIDLSGLSGDWPAGEVRHMGGSGLVIPDIDPNQVDIDDVLGATFDHEEIAAALVDDDLAGLLG